VHVAHKELAPAVVDDTIRWLKSVGSATAVLAGLPLGADANLAAWRAGFASLNDIGAQLDECDIRFAYHTQNDVWQKLDGVLLAEEMFRIVDPDACKIELDPSGSLIHGTDWIRVVRSNPGRYLAMHLRDGARPLERVPYLPALPLGEGTVDWDAALDAAGEAGIPRYILEMEVEPKHDVFVALETSLDFLEAMQKTKQ
jgi:sugar phosphate isomerase/epimerase